MLLLKVGKAESKEALLFRKHEMHYSHRFFQAENVQGPRSAVLKRERYECELDKVKFSLEAFEMMTMCV